MQLHAHMRIAGLLLACACAPCCWLWLSGAKGMQAPRRYRAVLTALRQRRRRRSAARCEKWRAPSSKYQVAEAESGEWHDGIA